MGATKCVLWIIIIYCALEYTCSFNDFVMTDFGNTIGSVWNDFVRAIKTPMKLRRPKRLKKKKITTTTTTRPLIRTAAADSDIEPTEATTISYRHHNTVPIIVPDGSNDHPIIPLIYQPEWRSYLDWRHLQKHGFLQVVRDLREREQNGKEDENTLYEALTSMKKQMIHEESSDKGFGILYFV